MSNLINSPKISIIGAKSGLLQREIGAPTAELESSDLALFLVSADEGIVSADLAKWRLARELYIPSLVIICDLLNSDIDFDDMSAIASKMLDPVATPFLILHDDDGKPAALIDLELLEVVDYSTGFALKRPADQEHIELVSEFRDEYLAALEDAGEDSFAAGLFFPALPWIEETRMGIDQIIEYLNEVPSSS